MPVSRPPFVAASDFRCTTALGIVPAAVLLIGAPIGAQAQSTIINTGIIDDGDTVDRIFSTLTITNNAVVTFDGSAAINLDTNNAEPDDKLIVDTRASFIAQAGTIDFDATNEQEPDVTNDGTMTVDGGGAVVNVGAFTNTGTAI